MGQQNSGSVRTLLGTPGEGQGLVRKVEREQVGKTLQIMLNFMAISSSFIEPGLGGAMGAVGRITFHVCKHIPFAHLSAAKFR